MSIVKLDDLKGPEAAPERKSEGVVETGADGVPRTKTPHPAVSVDNLDLSPEAVETRKKAQAAAMDRHLEELAERCRKSGVTVYPRRKHETTKG